MDGAKLNSNDQFLKCYFSFFELKCFYIYDFFKLHLIDSSFILDQLACIRIFENSIQFGTTSKNVSIYLFIRDFLNLLR